MAETTKNDNPTKGTDKGSEPVVRDALDLGVPMLPGSDKEPTGPEDALGAGPTRGDYSNRIGPENYQPHEVVVGDTREDGSLVPVIESQRDRVEQGEVAGVKGGVDSAS